MTGTESKPNVALSDYEIEKARKLMGREPNDTEWTLLDIMWSEHAGYKSSRKFLKLFPTEGENVLLPVGDDCGIVKFDDKYGIAIAMESHNHPSAIEPVAGAATGVGGIVRDILSKGARPIACLDPLRLGDIRNNERSKYLFENIVKGIADYGNCLGVPTIGGETVFHSSFDKNPLVNVVCVGLIEQDKIVTGLAKKAGDTLLLVGSKTGRDGIHGVTFASEELSSDKEEESRPAVQIEDPFSEKLLIDSCLEAYATGHVVGCKDLGGGGFICATSEIVGKGGFGADIDLDKIHLREEGMEPWEILVSETQERMMLVVDQGHEEEVKSVFDKWDVPYKEVGKVISEDRFIVRSAKGIVVDIAPSLLADSPLMEREYSKSKEDRHLDVTVSDPKEYLLKLLNDPNYGSKKWVSEQYDHEVQTRSVTKPSGDAAVLRITDTHGIALSSDCYSEQCWLDPRKGAQMALAESIRNITCVGAEPLTCVDCLNFGNPEKPEAMWEFIESVEGLADAMRSYGIPVVSGNVSFYNESDGKAIQPSPVITILGKLALNEFTTFRFKEDDDTIVIIGKTKAEIGKSLDLDLELEKKTNAFILKLIRSGRINACHDAFKGGIALGLARMAFASGRGFSVNPNEMDEEIGINEKLFSESNARFIVTTPEPETVLKLAEDAGLNAQVIGSVGGSSLDYGVFSLSLAEAMKIWESAIQENIM
jgi:phosphoribosylformylglycinamidine synthase subunit PurL